MNGPDDMRSGAHDRPDGLSRLRRPAAGRRFVHRHAALVRVAHWINVVCLLVLLMSGLQIFNAHPALYWGEVSDFGGPAFAITAQKVKDGQSRGITVLAGRQLDTTGVLGFSAGNARAFPAWATLPSSQSLAEGRLWHFAFAWVFVINGCVYLLHGLLSRHFWRDLIPARHDFGRIGRTAWDHLRLRFPRGEGAIRYNVLQQISYLAVVFALLPVMVIAGLAMSPRIDAAFPELLSIFGGRQSARTIHFIIAFALLIFVCIHVFMVFISGVWNNMRSMVTGRYAIETGDADA
jgi:thiosulfate reductase cytochrome b subunit